MEANGLAQAPILVSGDRFLIEKYLAPQVTDLKMVDQSWQPMPSQSLVPALMCPVSKLQLVRDGDKWILNGNKMWITNAGVADWYFVVAYTDQRCWIQRNDSLYR